MYELYRSSLETWQQVKTLEEFENPDTVEPDSNILHNMICQTLYVTKGLNFDAYNKRAVLGQTVRYSSYEDKYSDIVSDYDHFTLANEFQHTPQRMKFSFPPIVFSCRSCRKSLFLYEPLHGRRIFQVHFVKHFTEYKPDDKVNFRVIPKTSLHKNKTIWKSNINGTCIQKLSLTVKFLDDMTKLTVNKLYNPQTRKVLMSSKNRIRLVDLYNADVDF